VTRSPGSSNKVHVANRQRGCVIDADRFAFAVGRVLELAGQSGQELSVVLVSDRTIKRYNREYRGVNEPTDVISFSMREGEWGDMSGHLLGDLVISVQTVARQSTEEHCDDRPRTGTFQKELALMTIHGILHLLGYEHEENPEGEREMVAKERELFEQVWELFPT